MTNPVIVFPDSFNRFRQLFGDQNVETSFSILQLGLVLRDQAKYTEAEKLFTESIKINRQLYGDYNETTEMSIFQLGLILTELERYGDAEKADKKVFVIYDGFYYNLGM